MILTQLKEITISIQSKAAPPQRNTCTITNGGHTKATVLLKSFLLTRGVSNCLLTFVSRNVQQGGPNRCHLCFSFALLFCLCLLSSFVYTLYEKTHVSLVLNFSSSPPPPLRPRVTTPTIEDYPTKCTSSPPSHPLLTDKAG